MCSRVCGTNAFGNNLRRGLALHVMSERPRGAMARLVRLSAMAIRFAALAVTLHQTSRPGHGPARQVERNGNSVCRTCGNAPPDFQAANHPSRRVAVSDDRGELRVRREMWTYGLLLSDSL